MTTKTHTFNEMFGIVTYEVPFGCECCGTKVDTYYKLRGDLHGANACGDCADQHVEEVNAGIWEW